MATSTLQLSDGLTPERREKIKALYQAFNEGRPDLLEGVLAVDWDDRPTAPGQSPGRAGAADAIAAAHEAFEEITFTPREMLGAGDQAAVRLVFSGRHIGEWMGVPATGKRFEISWHELHHFKADLIKVTWHVEDWDGWRQQVGAAT